MNIYEEEAVEKQMELIADQLGYLMLDLILMSLKKINIENQTCMEFIETRLQMQREDEF